MAGFTEHRLGRQMALQFLFGMEFQELDWRLALPEFWRMKPAAVSQESLDPGEAFVGPRERIRPSQVEGAQTFAEPLIAGVFEHKAELDTMISSALDNWRPERVGRIEWVLLRMALFEMTWCPESPDAVVIAEAIRLATLFGDAESPRFINGILNRFIGHDPDETDAGPSPELRQPS